LSAHFSRLEHREEICERTLALACSQPSAFHFRAGQYVEMSLIAPKRRDIGGSSRSFSIASAPFENQLLFIMR